MTRATESALTKSLEIVIDHYERLNKQAWTAQEQSADNADAMTKLVCILTEHIGGYSKLPPDAIALIESTNWIDEYYFYEKGLA